VYQDQVIQGAILSFNDITDSFYVLQEQQRLLQIAEASPNMMITFSLEGDILSLNKSASDIFGIADEQRNSSLHLRDLFRTRPFPTPSPRTTGPAKPACSPFTSRKSASRSTS